MLRQPDWEAGGARPVSDVAPWEAAELAMPNGAHSLIAWAGRLLGHESVANAVADPVLRARIAAVLDRLLLDEGVRPVLSGSGDILQDGSGRRRTDEPDKRP